MKQSLLFMFIAALVGYSLDAEAQRFNDEVFTDGEIVVESDIPFATNIDFLTSDFGAESVPDEVTELQTAVFLGNPIPAPYFDPGDESTAIKVKTITMDIYQPDQEVDNYFERPVIVYIHTGNFLPPPINGSPNGLKNDLVAVALCEQWAKRGYVAVSVDYRLGWNPIAPTVQERRGTLLNAVYRAIHDVKQGVIHLKESYLAGNEYNIDQNRIVLYGQGSGGYVAQAYTTLDNPEEELFLDKFLLDPFNNISYIDTSTVGNPDGYNGTLTLYQNEGLTSEVQMSVNAGGALADESWLEAGDVPMVAFNCIRDDFAPFDEGTVIVPTTLEEVVDVHGANVFIQKANDLGNNDVFAGLPSEPYTDRARSLYGETFEVSNGGMITVSETPEGLFPLELPLTGFLTNQASPWEWWDPNSPLAMYDLDPGPDVFTTNQNSLISNPDMSEEKGLAYVDSIQKYMLPRVMCVLDLPENLCEVVAPGNDLCADAIDISELTGAAIGEEILSDTYTNTGATVGIEEELGGWECFGEPDGGGADPSVDNTVWFTFEGDGLAYTININDCNGTADYIFEGDSQLAMYEGNDCENLVPIDCNEDGPQAADDNYYAEFTGFETQDGTTYYMMLDGFDWSELGSEESAQGEFCIQFEQVEIISVEESDNAGFEIYPNPAKDLFTVTATDRIEGITITNLLGAVVDQIQAQSSNTVSIDAAKYTAGVYLINVDLPSGIQTSRLVIQ